MFVRVQQSIIASFITLCFLDPPWTIKIQGFDTAKFSSSLWSELGWLRHILAEKLQGAQETTYKVGVTYLGEPFSLRDRL